MNSKHLRAFIALFLVVGLASCMNNNLTDESLGKAAENDQQIKNYLTANQLQDKVKTTASGLYYILSGSPTSTRTATPGDELEFRYTLSYIDPASGKAIVVDSTNRTKSAYIPFLSRVVVAGLEEGFQLMQEGQSAQFFMTSNLAFGNDDTRANLPKYSAVIFDVKLIRSRTEIQQMDDYAALKKLPAPDTTTANNVRVYRLTKGTGARVNINQTVTVAYTANLLRGTTPFDKSDSLTLKPNSGQYIVGFSEGITKLNVGDKALLVFPSAVGYGAQGSSDSKGYYVVTPYSPLAFEITVRSAK
ncbi:hypothetical protein GCM10028803_57330 [Larkinella knui]|uniref:Peptidyl-prolyl cis-trans isomerase n=1 Tax=Larkinella knui TaxID=2025310 RepID=A0A3P1CHT0_9BACT|nr:FKBP-type peptidyl-prolyl cis-trans isomerase [Larkinella knui]RRB12825.1 hypothetical protein EHT87_21870 [Larkinella knui]